MPETEIDIEKRNKYGMLCGIVGIFLNLILFAGKLFGAVVFRESNLNVLLFADFEAFELLFETRDKGAGAEAEVVIFGVAAVEFHSVNASGEVDGDEIALPACSVLLNFDEAGLTILR